MKLKYLFVCVLICVCTLFTGCGASDIDYDLSATGFQFRYDMVTTIKNSPDNYTNKTIKLRGNIRHNGNTYHYITETDNVCCTWKMEVRVKDESMEYPTDNEEVIVVGEYLSYNINGVKKYYLQINQFVDNI